MPKLPYLLQFNKEEKFIGILLIQKYCYNGLTFSQCLQNF